MFGTFFFKELVAKLGSGDFHIINGVLQTAHSLFKRFVCCVLLLPDIVLGEIKRFGNFI